MPFIDQEKLSKLYKEMETEKNSTAYFRKKYLSYQKKYNEARKLKDWLIFLILLSAVLLLVVVLVLFNKY